MDQSSSHFHSQEHEGGKFNIDAAETLVEAAAPLPETYGDNRLITLPRDPFWFFAYWELSPDRMNAIRQEFGSDAFERFQAVLRVYDVTEREFDGSNAHRAFDVGVIFGQRQAYVQVEEAGRAYVVDLGLKTPEGRFISLLRSNRIQLPRGRVCEQTDSQWMAVDQAAVQEDWDQLLRVSGVARIGTGSAEASKNFAQRWEFLRSVFSGSSSKLSSSGAWTSPPSQEGKTS